MSGPIKPENAEEKRKDNIPEEVFEAFNKLIVQNLSDGRSSFLKNDAMYEILKNPPKEFLDMDSNLVRQKIYDLKYLDVEESYRDAGWNVKYEGPAYWETFEDYFEFIKPLK